MTIGLRADQHRHLRAEQAEPAGIRKGDTLKVFVLNMRGKPLMPCSPAKARHMLKAGQGRRRASNAVHDQADHRHRRAKQDVTLGVDAGARHVWHFRHDGRRGRSSRRGQVSTGHHGTSGRSSGIPTCKAQPKDALPLPALPAIAFDQKAQGWLASSVENRHSGAHVAHRCGLQTCFRHQDRD